MKSSILLIIYLAIFNTTLSLLAEEAKKPHPNILVILVDDMGYADVSCYGDSPEVNTPNIDKIAKAGVLFTDGYVSGLQCAPTRAGLLSGKYQQRFGFYHNRAALKPTFLPQLTLPQALKTHGYRTGMIGKWHLGRHQEEERPYHRGFDEFYGFLQGMRNYMEHQPKSPLMRNEKVVKEKFGYLTDFLNREAVSFIERSNSEKPFFLYVAYNAPHYPLEAKESYLKKYNTGNPNRDKQLAMMASVDEGVGQMLNALKKKGMTDNTLIFFLNDNGGEIKRGADNGKLRAGKNSLYEGGPRVPFLVSWPNQIKPGQVISTPVISFDIFSTAVAAAGGKMPAGHVFDGKNMLPLLTGKSKEPLHQTFFWQQVKDKWAVRHENWKLVNQKGIIELYNLEDDLSETKDLASQETAIVEKLKNLYSKWDGQMKGFSPIP